ncbi:single-strand DNA-binding protein B [Streptococcus pneumoniae]|nr:single-strand DNA-binding protein B [Streptococcus pneumoniae]
MYNKVIMIGRLTSTPELHKTNNDKSVARATIAVNRRYKDQNGEREADFVNMVLWGRLAETLASYATKGSLISVDGELRTRRFEKNGQMNYVTEVLVTGFQFLEVVPNVLCVKIMQAKIWQIWSWKRKNCHFKN